MSDDTAFSRAPDLADQLKAFNAARAELLGKRLQDAEGIDPEGERALGRLLYDRMEKTDEVV